MKTLPDTINRLINRPCPFAVFFYPGEKEPEIVLQQTSNIHKLNSFEDLNYHKGFVFAPFSCSDRYPLVVIEPDIHLKGFQDIARLQDHLSPAAASISEHTKAPDGNISKPDYLKSLNRLIDRIKAGHFDKVIFSRTISTTISEDLTIGDLFMKLKEKADSTLVYLVCLPGIGVWMGGTPELLLLKKNGDYQTVSLAGTLPVEGRRQDLEWSAGMKREQQIVTDFIEGQLKSFRIENYSQTGPVTEYAGNVAHLKTTFEFSGDQIDPQLTSLIAALHPGPAICGFPTETAKAYILQNEKHHREYYCGFLGNWKIEDHVWLYVNIRCMKILNDRAVIYVGGGITSDSAPESEWEETNHKAKTLLSVIKNNKHDIE